MSRDEELIEAQSKAWDAGWDAGWINAFDAVKSAVRNPPLTPNPYRATKEPTA